MWTCKAHVDCKVLCQWELGHEEVAWDCPDDPSATCHLIHSEQHDHHAHVEDGAQVGVIFALEVEILFDTKELDISMPLSQPRVDLQQHRTV